MIRLLVSLLLLSVLLPTSAQAAELAGTWQGEWIKNGDPVAVTMTFTHGSAGLSGEFSSDDLQAAGIPIRRIRDADGRVHFEVDGDTDKTVFDGEVRGNTLSGTFAEDGATGQFRFTRAPHLNATVESRDVTFVDGRVRLAGTLLIPHRQGRLPAILFLQGSGPEGRWANRWLAQKFAEAGFVALIYDKRGVGGSSGDWKIVGFDALAEDGAAGVRFLRSLPMTIPSEIGIYGHSQGGSVAPLVATDAGALAFVIASAAPGLNPDQVEQYSVGNSIGINDLPIAEQADAKDYVSAIVAGAYRGPSREHLDALAERYKNRSWFFPPPPPSNSYWTLSRAIAGFDPSAAWRRVKAPVLLVYGAKDERVPPTASIEAIHAALAKGGNQSVAIKLYADADHIFTIVGSGAGGRWAKHEPDYASTLISWARNVLARRRT